MESSDRCTDLFLGLPDELVLTHVITRLPWHDRPVCRAVSTTWRDTIDASTKYPHLLQQSRQHLLPLLQDRFLVFTFDYNVFISDKLRVPHEGPRTGCQNVKWRKETYHLYAHWRKLPSLERYFSRPRARLTVLASFGMIYVWSDEQQGVVLKIDMAGGDWTWHKISVPYPFNARAVPYKAKIYVPGVWTQGESPGTESIAVLVHGMMDEKCHLIRTWNHEHLRVLSTKISGASLEGDVQTLYSKLYSLVEHMSASEPELKILVYDACEDVWTTKDKIPFPDDSDVENCELVNMDCFEPSPDRGINIVYADPYADSLLWFNTSLREGWVEFKYNRTLMERSLEHFRWIHGQLYGIFILDKDCVEEQTGEIRQVHREKQDPWQYKKTIMKGTMVAETKEVHWEEVLGVGCFIESYYHRRAMVYPVEQYAMMA